MKKSLFIPVLAALSLSSPLAWADEIHHADKDMKPSTTMAGKDKPMQMGKMQENMLLMHEKMHKIMDAKNPQERERLMQEHSNMMQDNMRMMQGMKGQGMMGSDAKGGKMDGGMQGK
jgi:hypothetical protein